MQVRACRLHSCPAFTTASSVQVWTTTAVQQGTPRSHLGLSPGQHCTPQQHTHSVQPAAFSTKATHSKSSNRGPNTAWSFSPSSRSRCIQHIRASYSMASSSTDQLLPGSLLTATLKDGRTVSYSVCGSTAPDAHTVLFLHPIQGNRWD